MAKKADEIIQKLKESRQRIKVDATVGITKGAVTRESDPIYLALVAKKREKKPAFLLDVEDTYLDVPPGQFRETIVKVISVNGFDKIVSLSLHQNQPSPGLTVNLADHSLDTIPNGEVATTLRVWSANNAFGETIVTVTAKGGGLKDQSVPVTIHVSDPRPKPAGDAGVHGHVYDDDERRGIPDARVYIEMLGLETLTDNNGYYRIITGTLGDFLVAVAAEEPIIGTANTIRFYPFPDIKEVKIDKDKLTRCDFGLRKESKIAGLDLKKMDVENEISKIEFMYNNGKISRDEAIRQLEDLYYKTKSPEVSDALKSLFGITSLLKRGAPGGVSHYLAPVPPVSRGLFFGKIKEGPAQTVQRMDPKIRSAINSGRRELQKQARDICKKLLHDLDKRVNAAKTEVKDRNKEYKDLMADADKIANAKGRTGLFDAAMTGKTSGKEGGGGIGAVFGMVSESLKGLEGNEKDKLNTELILKKLDDAGKKLEKAEKEFDELRKLEADPRNAIERLLNDLTARVDQIIGILIMKRPDLEEKKDLIKQSLNAEARRIAYWYGSIYKNTALKKLSWVAERAMNLSSGMQTWGDVWGLFWDNIKTIIFGPWVWGTLLIILQWFMISAWVSPIIPGTQFYLYMMPFLLGLFTFMMNIESSRQPMDWITHIISGALIGFTTILLLIAIWTPQDLATFNFAGSSEGLWYNSWIFFFQ